ncbi:MAG: hypothetical protein LBN07_04860 [Christensenellaceae bacterium]|jgi:hypothetical protein|nr:hypothetical protein [Christensenellaceae bacterium]
MKWWLILLLIIIGLVFAPTLVALMGQLVTWFGEFIKWIGESLKWIANLVEKWNFLRGVFN